MADTKLPTGALPLNDLVGLPLEVAERMLILEAYKRHNQNKTRTAEALGVCVRTLRAKLKKYRDDQYLDDREAA